MFPYMSSSRPGAGFPLAHPDLHTGNIFVDKDLNITCIIDWASASSVPPAELLVTPALQGSVFLPQPSLAMTFRAGFVQASVSLPPAPDAWAQGDMMWYFQRLVRMLGIRDYHHFESLCTLVRRSKGSNASDEPMDIPELINDRMQRAETRCF